MGGADCVCSDKTGTLTQNKMVLKVIWNNKPVNVDESAKSYNLKDGKFKVENSGDLLHLIRTSMTTNSSALLET